MTIPKALVVEDDDRIVPSIEDALFSLGHELDWVTNQADAQTKLDSNGYDYMLLDLEIPARPHRGGASTECGANLLRTIRQVHGPAKLPVIIMTAHGNACVDLTKELTRCGASEFISKPFPTKGRTLATVIRDVLADRGSRNTANLPPKELRPFQGGKMIFGTHRIELLGEMIAEKTERANYWQVLQTLKERRLDGRYVPARAMDLAGLFKGGKATQNTVSSCIGALRERIGERMAARGFKCNKNDVIVSGGPGYRLNPWVEVEERDGDIAGTFAGTCRDTNMSEQGHVPANVPASSANAPPKSGNVPLNDRQHWALDQLRQTAQLRREQIEDQFGVGEKTAKRDLSDLAKRGLVEYVRTPKPGCYRLAKR